MATGAVVTGADLLAALEGAGFDLFTGTPCSHLGDLVARLEAPDAPLWIPAPNEGDAVALALGARLGGRTPVALFQNSGLGNAVNALTSLCDPFGVPVLLVVSHRGRPGLPTDEPQHRLMGRITEPLLDAMDVGRAVVGDEPVDGLVERAVDTMERTGRSFALVVPPGVLAKASAATTHPRRAVRRHDTPAGDGDPAAGAALPNPASPDPTAPLPTRDAVLRAVLAGERPDDVVLGTTGHVGRALHDLADGPRRLYVVGGMGSASALGTGLAVALGDHPRAVVLDGDGALLMRLGNLALVGHHAPPSFLHVVLDNGVHASTGGQATTGPVDFAAAARACGYAGAETTSDPGRVAERVRETPPGPYLLHVRMSPAPGGSALPGRPGPTPREVAERLRAHLAEGRAADEF